MDEIAAEAGITKPILYRHFGDRRGLARALRDGALGPLLGIARDTPLGHRSVRERIVAMYPVVSDAEELRRVVVGFATGFLMFVGMSPNLYRFLRAEGVLDEMWEAESGGAVPREPVAESIARSLQAIYRGAHISDTTADIWAHALRAMASGMVDWWIDTPGCDRFELERNIDRIAHVVVSGLGQTLAAERSLARGTRRKPAARRARKPAVRRGPKPRR